MAVLSTPRNVMTVAVPANMTVIEGARAVMVRPQARPMMHVAIRYWGLTLAFLMSGLARSACEIEYTSPAKP